MEEREQQTQTGPANQLDFFFFQDPQTLTLAVNKNELIYEHDPKQRVAKILMSHSIKALLHVGKRPTFEPNTVPLKLTQTRATFRAKGPRNSR